MDTQERLELQMVAESQASEQTLMAIAGHVSRRMIEHYSYCSCEGVGGVRTPGQDIPKELYSREKELAL